VKDGVLQCSANGEFTYQLRGVHARVRSMWDFSPPPGGGDSHHSVVRGTKATLIIRQGREQNFKPVLYVERAEAAALTAAIAALQGRYPGIGLRREGAGWAVTIPDQYDVGHEAHFVQVTENFLGYLRAGRLPDWEEPNMITKCATIMQAYELSFR